jgi:hypothetical protein
MTKMKYKVAWSQTYEILNPLGLKPLKQTTYLIFCISNSLFTFS